MYIALSKSSHLTLYRLSYGISTRSPRIHPTETLTFHQYEIPAGASLSSFDNITYQDLILSADSRGNDICPHPPQRNHLP